MFGFGKPQCPVEQDSAQWLESGFSWLCSNLGGADLAQRVVVEPTDEFFPLRLNSDENARSTFERICGWMGIDPASVQLEFIEGDSNKAEIVDKLMQWRGNAPAGTWDNEAAHRIRISRDTFDDPMHFVAVAAHELGHQILLGGGLLAGDEEDHEPLTDLLTVYKGLGIFGANSCIHFGQYDGLGKHGHEWATRGYLQLAEWAYALALFARARGESKPAWRKHLRPDARDLFDKSAKWLTRT